MGGSRWHGLIALLLSAPVASAQEKARLDALGDPLPAGAVARLGTTRFHPGWWISQLAFSPEGDRLACCSENGLTVYDSATGRDLRHVPVAFSPDVRARALAWPKRSRGVVVLELEYGKFYVWDFTDPKAVPPPIPRPMSGRVIKLGEDGERYDSFAVSPDGNHLAVGRRGRLNKQRTIDLLELVPGKWVHELNVVRRFGPRPGDCVGLAFTGDNRSLLAFSHERGAATERLITYDVASGEPGRQMAVPANALRTVDRKNPEFLFFEYDRPFALAPDGRTVALAAGDGTVRVWDMTAGKEIRTVARHLRVAGGKVTAKGAGHLAFGAGGRLLTAGCGRTFLRDAASGRQIREIGPSLGDVFTLAVSPDGKRFATGDATGRIRLWEAETGAGVSTVADYPDVGWGGTTAIAPDGRTAASASTYGGICVWDLAEGSKRRRIDRGSERAIWVGHTPDGRALLVGGEAKMRLFDLATGKPLPLPGELRSAGGQIAGLAADRRTLITAHKQDVTLWDWPAGRPRRTFKLPGQRVNIQYVHLSPDARRLVTSAGTDSGEAVEVWETATGRSLGRLEFPENRGLRPVHSPDGSALLLEVANSGYGNPVEDGLLERPELSLWDPRRLTRRYYFAIPPLGNVYYGLQLGPVAFAPDGRTLAVGLGNRPITLFEVATGQVRRQLAGHRNYITSLEFTPDGRRLLSTSTDRTGLVWDVRLAAAAKPAAAPDQLWEDLADPKAAPAYQAMARLAADPDRAVALVRARLKPARAPGDAELDRIVAGLDSARFAVRQKAAAELDRLGDTAVPGVAARLGKAESLELRRRLEQFLAKHDRDVPPPDRLREGRALELLEQIDTAEARAVLWELAGGAPAVRLTQEARRALERLRGAGQY
jgi:WD40 repeat protein